jgi:glutamate mutase epsilon subunit
MPNDFYFFKNIKEFIKDDYSLDEEMREKYLTILEKIGQNQAIDYEDAYKFLKYLEDIFDEAEEMALLKRDSQAIKTLAQARQERNLLMTIILGGEAFNKVGSDDDKQAEIDKIKQTLQQQATT